jgi:galactose mutarotase-like enzyme
MAEALDRVGSLDQIARVDSSVDTEGASRGSRRIHVVTGGGLEYDVHPDRALDLGAATLDGIPLAWMSSTGIADPRFAEPDGRGWLRTFGGGLLATCGLDSFGPSTDDEFGVAPMHGRIGAVPARVTRSEATTDELAVAGTVRQTRVFGENLVLQREISSALGSTTITVRDTVTNEGAQSSPHMILYHANIGWPLLDDGVTVEIPAARVTPRDSDAGAGFDTRYEIAPPVAGFLEQVFVHEETDGFARVTNPRLGIRLTLRFSSETLPALFQWKMTDVGHYVLGLEPTNTPEIMGRAAARESDRLPILEPRESVRYQVSFEFTRI